MNRKSTLLLLILFCLAAPAVQAATGRVIKVLPHLLDPQGQHTSSPSLYERDAYQAELRRHPERVGGIRYDVHFKARGGQFAPLKIKVELRGVTQGNLPRQTVLEQDVKLTGVFGKWIGLALEGQSYKDFGTVTAWRVTLWEGEELLSEQTSFLW